MTAATGMALPAAVRSDTVIVRLEAARTALAEAKSIQQTKAIADVAAAAEIYAARQKLGEEAVDYAHAVKIEALRKLGELLKNGKDRGEIAGPGDRKCTGKEHLAEIGIDRKTSSMAQRLAALPEKDFEAVRDGHEAVGKAIAKASQSRGTRQEPREPAKPKDDAKARAELIDLQGKYADLLEKNAELADLAQELNDKLEALSTTEPDEQQKLIADLQLKLRKKDAEIDRQRVQLRDANNENNALKREVKRLQRRAGVGQ